MVLDKERYLGTQNAVSPWRLIATGHHSIALASCIDSFYHPSSAIALCMPFVWTKKWDSYTKISIYMRLMYENTIRLRIEPFVDRL